MVEYSTMWTWMKKMDEIHRKETMFDETFQMNLFLVNGYP
jgi:hypothetical protein